MKIFRQDLCIFVTHTYTYVHMYNIYIFTSIAKEIAIIIQSCYKECHQIRQIIGTREYTFIILFSLSLLKYVIYF